MDCRNYWHLLTNQNDRNPTTLKFEVPAESRQQFRLKAFDSSRSMSDLASDAGASRSEIAEIRFSSRRAS